MARLTDLPVEIVDLVLQSCRNLLTALMRVCKSIHKIAEPLLYSEILMRWDDCVQPSSSINLLLRTVLKRPQLALLIKHVRLRNSAKAVLKPANNQLAEDTIGDAWLVMCVDKFPSPDIWEQQMRSRSVPVVVAFLLSRLHRLETLELGAKFQSIFLGLMFGHALACSDPSSSISTFRHLTQVELTNEACSPKAGTLMTDQIISIFRLPSIKSMSFLALDEYGSSHMAPYNSVLRSLNLHHSQIREDTLERLLAATPNLTSLKCGFWCDPEPMDGRSSFLNCAALGRALRHARSIEYLAISVKFFTSSAMEVDWGGAYEKGEHWGIKGSIGSLKELTHLKSLEIPIVVLLGWVATTSAPQFADVLPGQLRQLLLRNDLNFFYKYEWNQQACLDNLTNYLGSLKICGASLEEIVIRLKDCAPEDRWDQDTRNALGWLCRAVNVSCTFDPPM